MASCQVYVTCLCPPPRLRHSRGSNTYFILPQSHFPSRLLLTLNNHRHVYKQGYYCSLTKRQTNPWNNVRGRCFQIQEPGLHLFLEVFILHPLSYFLHKTKLPTSHFHSDHYTGINKNWSNGPIHCSQITARLLISQLEVPPSMVVAMPLNQRISLGNDCYVQFMDANHCPGAVVLLFDLPSESGPDRGRRRIVHCGDFRYHPSMKLWGGWGDDPPGVIEEVMLDTTVCTSL